MLLLLSPAAPRHVGRRASLTRNGIPHTHELWNAATRNCSQMARWESTAATSRHVCKHMRDMARCQYAKSESMSVRRLSCQAVTSLLLNLFEAILLEDDPLGNDFVKALVSC